MPAAYFLPRFIFPFFPHQFLFLHTAFYFPCSMLSQFYNTCLIPCRMGLRGVIIFSPSTYDMIYLTLRKKGCGLF